MNYFIGVMQTLLPVIIVLGIGVYCRHTGRFSREGIDTLKNTAVNIALPAVLLNAFATTEYSLQNVIIPIVMFGICIAGWLLGKAVCALSHMKNRFIPYLTTGFEAGMLGYTLFIMLYGEENVSAFAMIDLGQVLFVFTMYKLLLNSEFSEKSNTKELIKSMVTSPIIIAIAAGVIIGSTGLYDKLSYIGFDKLFDACVSFISAPASVLILLAIGYDLVLKDINWKETGKVVLLRMAIMLLLMGTVTLVIKSVFPGNEKLILAVRVMFILPPPYVLPIFADDSSQYTYISSALTVSTMLSIVCFAIMAFI